MKRHVVEILNNLIGKSAKADGNKNDPVLLHAEDPLQAAGTAKKKSAVRVVERKLFERIVNEYLSVGHEYGCLLVCDVDRCREINDIYGHDTGDAVLRNVADVLHCAFGTDAYVGNLGGDVFALWLDTTSRDSAGDVRVQVGVVNDRLLHPAGELPPVSVSVGAAFGKPGDDYKSFLKRANKALYLVKESGRCGCEISL